MNKNKISVLIPSYNHAKYLKKAIDSVLNQTFQDFELIIMDDCSTDNSKKIINSYKDVRIKKYFSDSNQGAVENLNKLIDLASCEYIAILNSDDYWELDKLQKQFDYMEKNTDIAACFTWADFVDEFENTIFDKNEQPMDLFTKTNKSREKWFKSFFDNGNCLCHPSVLIRSSVYQEIGKYKNIYRQLPDFEMWIRLIKKYNIYILEENLTHFRIVTSGNKNSSFLSDDNKNLMIYEMFMIKSQFFDCDVNFFYEAFSEQIVNKKCINDNNMLEFEKNIILYNCIYYKQCGRFIAYNNISNLLNKKGLLDLLEREYNFTLNDFYELGKKTVAFELSYTEEKIIEKIPDHIANSRFYRIINRIYKTKLYNLFKRIRIKIRNVIH